MNRRQPLRNFLAQKMAPRFRAIYPVPPLQEANVSFSWPSPAICFRFGHILLIFAAAGQKQQQGRHRHRLSPSAERKKAATDGLYIKRGLYRATGCLPGQICKGWPGCLYMLEVNLYLYMIRRNLYLTLYLAEAVCVEVSHLTGRHASRCTQAGIPVFN